MANSFSPFCGGCPVHGFSGQGSPAGGYFRRIPAPVFAAGLFLLLVIAAILVQALFLHISPAPAATNASSSPSPALTPEGTVLPGTPVSGPARQTSGPELKNPGNTAGAEAPVTTMTGVSSREVTVINASFLEKRVHELVNRARQEHGRSLLGTDTALASLARAHSTDMASKGYFGHVNLEEMDPTARGAAAGYICHKGSDTYYAYGIAENIFATYRYGSTIMVNGRETESDGKSDEAIAEETVDAWMNSPDHRDNILDPGMGREGIGVAFGQGDMVFVTQDFC